MTKVKTYLTAGEEARKFTLTLLEYDERLPQRRKFTTMYSLRKWAEENGLKKSQYLVEEKPEQTEPAQKLDTSYAQRLLEQRLAEQRLIERGLVEQRLKEATK